MRKALLVLTFALSCAALDELPFPGHDVSKIQVLLLTGYNSTPTHRWREIDPRLRAILEGSGQFEVHVEEEPRGITNETLAGYRILLLNYSDYTPSLGMTWPEQTREAYLQFLKRGGGVVSFHVTLGSFPEWPEFRKTLGIADNSKIGHGPYHDFRIKVTAGETAIMRGIPESFAGWGEIYNRIDLSPEVQVLARAWDDPDNCLPNHVSCGSGKDEPIIWTNRYGNGRVFVTTMGHDLKAISSPEFRTTLLQGMTWAATGKVDGAAAVPTPKRGGKTNATQE
jgi:type 1 glutamine amidotransferase